jgi:alpha-tubulin suppressor-like RCC1 family protein
MGLDNHNQIWSWGRNIEGQLGNNEFDNCRCFPVSLGGIKKTFCQIFCGDFHGLALDYNGQAWAWGDNSYGNLGNNDVSGKCTPVSVHGVHTFCQISGGYLYSVAIDNNNIMWSWGYNNFGQLGDNTTSPRCIPVKVCPG